MNGWRFWITIIFLPSALATFILTRRFSAYEASKLDIQAKNEVVAEYNESVFDVASKPIAVLATAYRFSCDRKENAMNSILDKSTKLVSQVAIAQDAVPINARWLVVPSVTLVPGPLIADKSRHLEATKWLFTELIEEIAEAVEMLPQRFALEVHFFMSSLLSTEDRDHLWNDQWEKSALRPMNIAVGDDDADLITLDRWLDQTIVTPKNKVRLIVAIQMNILQSASPPVGSSEAAVALLLLPRTAALGPELISTVMLHRPVRAEIAHANEALQPALKWADTEAADIDRAWQTGFDATQWGQAYQQAAMLELTENVIKMDQSIGWAGVAAPWLAIACAAKSISDDTPKQIVFAGSESAFDCAVLVRSVATDVFA